MLLENDIFLPYFLPDFISYKLCIYLQGLQQDILAYEHMIDSVKSKAKELTLKSSDSALTSQSSSVVIRFDKLKDRASVRNHIPEAFLIHSL